MMSLFCALRRSTWIWVATLIGASVLGLFIGHRLPARSSGMPCMALRVIYHDGTTETGRAVFNGKDEGATELHAGSATYVFKKCPRQSNREFLLLAAQTHAPTRNDKER